MKECGIVFEALCLRCSDFPKGKCLLMANDAIADGYIDNLLPALRKQSTSYLQGCLVAHSPGGQYADLCKSSPVSAKYWRKGEKSN